MCETHPGRATEVCGATLCAGCSEAEFLAARLPKATLVEPYFEPTPEGLHPSAAEVDAKVAAEAAVRARVAADPHGFWAAIVRAG